MTKVGNNKHLHYYRLSPEEVFIELGSRQAGLSSTEAEASLDLHGANTLFRGRRELALLTFLRQFKNLFVALLLASAALSIYLHDGKTAFILLVIALMNAVVGFVQEHKAETLMAKLEQLLVPRAKVQRDGHLIDIDSSQLVPGDVVALEAGDSIPADLRIFMEDELSTNDFALTGESNPSRKFVHAISSEVPLASRHNIAFMGTTVATGTARGVVIGTGMRTELGRIASLSQVTKSDASPLQKELDNLAARLTQATLVLGTILALIALQSHLGIKAAVLFAIGISAAMIPECLVAEVNITLAQTANRMVRSRALVKRLSAVETLGATNIILTDKTGTLTKNEMTVVNFLIGRSSYTVEGTGYDPNGSILDKKDHALTKKELKGIGLFLSTGALASNAKVNPPDDAHRTWYVMGDPTEGAIVTLARKAGLAVDKLDTLYPEIKEYQFDSGRKLMSSVRQYENGEIAVFVKGAPEAIMARSTSLWDHVLTRKLTDKDRAYFHEHTEAAARMAMRNLAFAYRILPKSTDPSTLTMKQVEQDLTFLGIVSMMDPLRDEVPAAMEAARAANIQVSIVTGDYPATAKAIAAKANLASTPANITVILADELNGLSDSQILQLVEAGGTVFSRVSPEDKLRIVEIAKNGGRVVAVTGDGINDAPALKRADIGVAMGKTGTDVAKDAADIVLLDDSFATLVQAIEQGRLTFHNIKKAARCVLTDNMGELFIILISLCAQALFHIPLMITAIEILCIDTFAETAPISALGWDTAQSRLMREQPRRLSDHILNLASAKEFITFGLLAALLASTNFLLFFIRHGLSPAYIDTKNNLYLSATTLAYVTLVLCQFANVLLVRADKHEKFFTSYLWSNKRLIAAFMLSAIAILNLIYNPFLQTYLRTGPLGFWDWCTAFAAGGVYVAVRLMQRHTRKHTRKELIRSHPPEVIRRHLKTAG